MKTDLIIDLQYGSTGKGLFAGYLASTSGKYDVAISANMPNAGHTFIDERGQKFIFKVLPSASLFVDTVLIGPGAVFDPDRLEFELEAIRLGKYKVPEVLIHPSAMILQDYHVADEKKHLTHIASTCQGSSAAMIEKIRRWDDDNTALHCGYSCTHDVYNQVLNEANLILAEGAQGYSLGIDQPFYPYTTSRNCTPAAWMDAMGIPLPMLGQVIGVARTYPIRVGGSSGRHYPDQIEITWDLLGVEAERTTVTDRKRRVFTMSSKQIEDAIWACGVDAIFMNFMNYKKAHDQVEKLSAKAQGMIQWWGYGPGVNDIVEEGPCR